MALDEGIICVEKHHALACSCSNVLFRRFRCTRAEKFLEKVHLGSSWKKST